MIDVYTVKEVAEILKVSQATVRKLIKEEHLPVTKIGTTWRVPAEILKKYIKENTNGDQG